MGYPEQSPPMTTSETFEKVKKAQKAVHEAKKKFMDNMVGSGFAYADMRRHEAALIELGCHVANLDLNKLTVKEE